MCITAPCPDPTEVGVWWRDDATWRLYSKQAMQTILKALLKGSSSLDLLASAPYHLDLVKMVQTNTSSGHKRAIKLILPSTFRNPNSNFFNKVEHSFAVDRNSVARFRVHNSCFLVICKGNIAEWVVDGKMDVVVSPRRMWGSYQSLKGSLTDICSYTDGNIDEKKRGLRLAHGSIDNIVSVHRLEQAKGSVAVALDCAAGPELREALRKGVRFATSGRCGDAMVTSGFKLPASHIIHSIVPKYRSSDQNAVVDSCARLERTYKGVMALATANGMRYLAFPAMACGAGGFPVEVAAQVAMRVVGSSSSNKGGVKEIHFVLMGEEGIFKEWVMQASKCFPSTNEA